MTKKTSKPQFDWPAIEREYRAGQLPVLAIAKRYGLTEAAIRKRAKRDGWARDLSVPVQRTVQRKLIERDAAEVAQERAEAAPNIVESAAERGALVVIGHRQDIRRGREMVLRLLYELEAATLTKDELVQIIEEETAGEKNPQRRNTMLRLVGLPSRAGVIRDLSTAMQRLINLERHAYNLDGKANSPEDNAETVDPDTVKSELKDIFGDDYIDASSEASEQPPSVH